MALTIDMIGAIVSGEYSVVRGTIEDNALDLRVGSERLPGKCTLTGYLSEQGAKTYRQLSLR